MTPLQPPEPVNSGSALAPQRVDARRGRIRALVRVVLVVLLASVGLVAVAPAAMADGLWNFHPVTYNMQGSAADGSSIDKWRRDVEPLLANHDVIALQEAGAPPASAVLLQRTVGVAGGPSVETYRWRLGSSTRGRDVYIHWLQTDPGANRVNLAIVTQVPPDEIRVVPNPLDAGRPALGVRRGSFWFYDVHALSGGGNDAPRLLERLRGGGAGAGTNGLPAANESYLVMGDMNRAPGSFPVGVTDTIIAPTTATQQSGGTLDWMITNSDLRTPQTGLHWTPRARVLGGFVSDHRPVDYTGLSQVRYSGGLRNMPLGSSTTYGTNSSDGNGYRADFTNGLGSISGASGSAVSKRSLAAQAATASAASDASTSLSVDEVGSVDVGTAPDRDNEGWPGFQIDAIAGKASCAVPVYQPNLVTLLAGANDIIFDHADGAPARLEALIEQISIDSPNTVVLVSGVQHFTDPAREARGQVFNAAVPGIVDQAVSRGMHAVYADSDKQLTTGDIGPDGIHPTDAGYQKIADAFLAGYKTADANGWVQAPNPQAADIGSNPCGHTDDGTGTTNTNSQVQDSRWEDHGVSFDAGFGQDKSYQWGDVNKDGKPELFVINPDQSWTFYWNGGRTDKGWTGWAKGVSRPARAAGLQGNQLYIADIDSDGEPDCLQVGPNGFIDAFVWDDTKPVGQKLCGKVSTIQHDVPNTGTIGAATDTKIVFADVDGNGSADYLLVQPRGTTLLWLSFPDKKPNGIETFHWDAMGQIAGPLTDARIRRWADINADGKADQILITAKGGARAWINEGFTVKNGERFDPPTLVGPKLVDIGQIATDKNVPPADVQFIDVGGDGAADFVRTGWTGVTHIWLNRLNPPYTSKPLGN